MFNIEKKYLYKVKIKINIYWLRLQTVLELFKQIIYIDI